MVKRIFLIFLLSYFLEGCNQPEEIKVPHGHITQVRLIQGTTYIEVEFQSECTTCSSSTEWFVGSDTCRVGQKILVK